ncbi:MAG: cytochrome c biogenesis protein ResB [Deltaproteobacteria bacterium]|nr:cytochrome c biogenesis protein ResB [Deltaproteobacteria bacterium]
MNVIIGIHAATYALAIALQHVVTGTSGDDAGRVRMLSVACGLLAFAGVAGGAVIRKSIFKAIASTDFGVVSLVTLTLLSILGTVILQNQPGAVFTSTYGSLSGVLAFLFVDDLFHSFAFSAIVGLAAGALTATLFKRKKLTARRLGVIGAHLGCLLCLAGAAVGSVWGVKGRLKMHVNEEASSFKVLGDDGKMAEVPLGYTVRLDEFELLHYEPEFRLRIFDIDEDGEDLVRSIDPLAENAPGELRTYGVAMNGYWPDHAMQLEVEPADPGAAQQAALPAVGLKRVRSDNGMMWLFDEGQPGGGRLDAGDAGVLAFFWQAARAEKLLDEIEAGGGGGSPHVLVAGAARLEVALGKSYSIEGFEGLVKVLSVYRDFVIDPETKRPSERSNAANNPAMEVEILDSGGHSIGQRWLFAKFPSFGHKDKAPGPEMRYEYRGQGTAFSKGLLLVGETGEAWTIEDAALAGKSSFKDERTVTIGGQEFVVAALHESAVASHLHVSRSDEALNPVVEIEIKGEQAPRFMGAGQAVEIGDGRVLALTPKGDDVRDFLSTVTVLEEGKPVLTRKVEVNSPLSFGGFSLYQSEYDPRDPTFSGFEVVRDPGLFSVYAGLVLMMLAVGHVMLVVPVMNRLRKRRSGGAGEGGK